MVMAITSSNSRGLLLEPQGNYRHRSPSRPEKGPTMNTNTGTTHRLHGPVAASAAFAANAWATVPLSRGSPPGRYPAGSGLHAAPLAAGDGKHTAAAAAEGRPS
jgi:hypothetical protein